MFKYHEKTYPFDEILKVRSLTILYHFVDNRDLRAHQETVAHFTSLYTHAFNPLYPIFSMDVIFEFSTNCESCNFNGSIFSADINSTDLTCFYL